MSQRQYQCSTLVFYSGRYSTVIDITAKLNTKERICQVKRLIHSFISPAWPRLLCQAGNIVISVAVYRCERDISLSRSSFSFSSYSSSLKTYTCFLPLRKLMPPVSLRLRCSVHTSVPTVNTKSHLTRPA